jgi:hypothetical protein
MPATTPGGSYSPPVQLSRKATLGSEASRHKSSKEGVQSTSELICGPPGSVLICGPLGREPAISLSSLSRSFAPLLHRPIMARRSANVLEAEPSGN